MYHICMPVCTSSTCLFATGMPDCTPVMPLSCLLQVIIPMDAPRILMLEVAEQVAAVTLVSHLPGIQAVSPCGTVSQTLLAVSGGWLGVA